jgi:hypothetical protein
MLKKAIPFADTEETYLTPVSETEAERTGKRTKLCKVTSRFKVEVRRRADDEVTFLPS